MYQLTDGKLSFSRERLTYMECHRADSKDSPTDSAYRISIVVLISLFKHPGLGDLPDGDGDSDEESIYSDHELHEDSISDLDLF
ncbi:unnamed protein product [Ambrosiozyma monospora]|uniref:Unnamed protein product n=1 Tax=Ambrosiozyma monospora TaxID=43982 RepID=A0A9W6WJ85_AMBMO|nr:unnamed protein product [Ambrosiozyma monospora]